MNTKRFIAASVTLFVFIYIYESVVHGVLLSPLYQETSNIWRSYNEMMAFMPFNITKIALISFWITFFFASLFKERGRKKGILFGMYVGVLVGIQSTGAYFYLPISFTLAMLWFAVNFVEYTVGGLIIGSIYRD